MRTLNLRLLAVLMVLGMVLCGLVYVVRGVQIRRNAGVYLRLAQRAKEAKKTDAAVRNYRLYLRLAPDDVHALMEFGGYLGDLGSQLALPERSKQAFWLLERATRLDPDRDDARRKLVEVLIRLGRHQDAKEHLEQYLLKASPEDGQLRDLLARCQEATGSAELAAQSYRLAIQYSPQRLETYQRLASLLAHRLNRPREADQWMERLVASNPRSAEAYVVRGRYLKGLGRVDEAAGDAARALELEPDHPGALLLASQCELAKDQLEAARRHANRVIQVQPTYWEAYVALAAVELRAGRRGDAIACLQRGVEAVPPQEELLGNLANLLLDEGRIGEAQATVDRVRPIEQARPLVAYLDARLKYVAGHWLAASRILEEVRPELVAFPDLVKQADFWLGGSYAQLGNADQQLAAYRRAVGADPFWIRARSGIASALTSMGRIDEALEESRHIVRLKDAPPEAWLQVARLSILRNLRLNRPNRNWAEAEAALDQAAKVLPGSIRVPILRVEALVGQDRFQEAEKLLSDVRTKEPKQVELWIAQAALAQRQRNWEAAEGILGEAKQRLGDSVPLRLADAQHLVRRYGSEAAARLRQLGEDTGRFSGGDLVELQHGLAAMAFRAGDYQHARRLCGALSKKEPNNLQLRILLFDLALRAEDSAAMEQTLQEIRQIEGQGPLWHYGRAVFLRLVSEKAGTSLLDQAQEHLAQAQTMRPAWSRLPLLTAEIHDRQNRLEPAIQNYLRAIDLGERDPGVVRRVVQLLYQQQRYTEADRVIRRLEEQQTPFSADLGRMAAEISLRLDDFDRALEMARQVAAGSKAYRDHIWLGQVLSLLGQRAKIEKRGPESAKMLREAENEFRQAIKLAENVPDTWVALIQFLGRTGQAERAEGAIADAQQKIPPGQAPMALAQCYEAVGRLDEAEKKYQAALAAAPNDPAIVRALADFYLRTGRPRQAEPQLDRLITGQVKASEDDLSWGRRSLGIALLTRGGYPNLERARGLVDQNLQASGGSLPDLRAKALVLASYPSRQQRREAIKMWESVLKQQWSLAPEDRFIVAQLYLAEGDWANAVRQMRTLLASQGNEPRYLAAYIAALLERKEVSEAELWLKRLEGLAPGAFTTVSLRAHALLRRGQFDRSIRALKDFAEGAVAESAERAVRLGLVARRLEEFAQELKGTNQASAFGQFVKEAEAMLRSCVERSPEQAIVLAAFLARQGRVDDSLGLTESSWEKATPEAVGEAVTAQLSANPVNQGQLQRIDRILQAALKRHGRPSSLLWVSATLLGKQQRFDEVEAAYREMLRKNGDDIVALNNLAVLLAAEGRQLDEAWRCVQKAIALAGPVPTLLDSRATVLLARGKPQEALLDLQQAIAESPSATFYLHQAQAYLLTGQKQAAADAFSKARQLGLKPDQLHPLERPVYEKLLASLK